MYQNRDMFTLWHSISKAKAQHKKTKTRTILQFVLVFVRFLRQFVLVFLCFVLQVVCFVLHFVLVFFSLWVVLCTLCIGSATCRARTLAIPCILCTWPVRGCGYRSPIPGILCIGIFVARVRIFATLCTVCTSPCTCGAHKYYTRHILCIGIWVSCAGKSENRRIRHTASFAGCGDTCHRAILRSTIVLLFFFKIWLLLLLLGIFFFSFFFSFFSFSSFLSYRCAK